MSRLIATQSDLRPPLILLLVLSLYELLYFSLSHSLIERPILFVLLLTDHLLNILPIGFLVLNQVFIKSPVPTALLPTRNLRLECALLLELIFSLLHDLSKSLHVSLPLRSCLANLRIHSLHQPLRAAIHSWFESAFLQLSSGNFFFYLRLANFGFVDPLLIAVHKVGDHLPGLASTQTT